MLSQTDYPNPPLTSPPPTDLRARDMEMHRDLHLHRRGRGRHIRPYCHRCQQIYAARGAQRWGDLRGPRAPPPPELVVALITTVVAPAVGTTNPSRRRPDKSGSDWEERRWGEVVDKVEEKMSGEKGE